MSDMFPIRNGLRQGDAQSPFLFNFTLEYSIRRVQISQDGLKLNGTHQFLVYADIVNILCVSLHTVKKIAEALVVASRETGLEENADKTKYMDMSRDQDAGRNHSIKIDNRSFELLLKHSVKLRRCILCGDVAACRVLQHTHHFTTCCHISTQYTTT